jgi:hypothetical protein
MEMMKHHAMRVHFGLFLQSFGPADVVIIGRLLRRAKPDP